MKIEDVLGRVTNFQGLHHGLLRFPNHLRPLFWPTYPPHTLIARIAGSRHLVFTPSALVLNVVLTLEATTATSDHRPIRGQPTVQLHPSFDKTLQRGQKGIVLRVREQHFALDPHRERS